jgi:hypothetical protein
LCVTRLVPGIDIDESAVILKRPGCATHGSPVISARGNTLLLGIGALKSLIYHDKVIIFPDIHCIKAEQFAHDLASFLQEQNSVLHEEMLLKTDVVPVEEGEVMEKMEN